MLRDKGYGMAGGRQELTGVKEQCLKVEIKSVGCLTFLTAVGISSNLPSDQGLANSFCKAPDVKYFRLCGPCGLCHDYSAIVTGKQRIFNARA